MSLFLTSHDTPWIIVTKSDPSTEENYLTLEVVHPSRTVVFPYRGDCGKISGSENGESGVTLPHPLPSKVVESFVKEPQ